MMIRAVDHRDVRGCMFESFGGRKTAEASTDDDDARDWGAHSWFL
jgi:hypothetical protein